jgi:pimeloyl-ACP methyl ester carboxylesterase
MSDTKHVVLIHGSWSRGEQWAPARAAFEQRGYTVHTPTLRHHERPLDEGAGKIAPLSLRDYTDDLVALIASLDGPPLQCARLHGEQDLHNRMVIGSATKMRKSRPPFG